MDQIHWAPEPLPEIYGTAEDLAVEALGDAETYRELLTDSLALNHRQTITSARMRREIIRLRDENRDLRTALVEARKVAA